MCLQNLPPSILYPNNQLRVITNASAFSRLREALHLVIIRPPILKHDLEAIVVMRILKMSFAMSLKEGNRFCSVSTNLKCPSQRYDPIYTHPILKFDNWIRQDQHYQNLQSPTQNENIY